MPDKQYFYLCLLPGMLINTKIKQAIFYLVTSLIIFLLTFPAYSPAYGTGLDPSYVWALNYLFSNDYPTLTTLIYPIGPLGFLKYAAALDNNLAYAITAFSLLKLGFLLLLLKLFQGDKKKIDFVGILLTLIAGWFAGFDLAIIGSVTISLLLYLKNGRHFAYFLYANLLAAFGLMVKSSIGIPAYAVLASFYLLYYILERPGWRKFVFRLAISLFVFLLVGVLVQQGFGSFYSFLAGTVHLAGGYASALALFPDNNWSLLGSFIFLMFLFPFLFKDGGARKAWMLLLLPLFATWKLAMGREDIFHYTAMIDFLVVYWVIIIANTERHRMLTFILPVITIVLFFTNAHVLSGKKNLIRNLKGYSNFYEAVISYNEFNERYKKTSAENVSENKLDRQTRRIISNRITDIYPWDLSYVPANDLNWVPRQTLELGASTSSWLSAKSAQRYAGSDAAEMVLLHLKKDRWGGRLGSLDGRYLLNDEPRVVANLMNNYHLLTKGDGFLLFERNMAGAEALVSSTGETTDVTWNEWIDVPKNEQLITRAKTEINKNLFGSLKTFLYKDEAYYIDYQLTDQSVITYRFVASNAFDGLWINPIIRDPLQGRNSLVSKVRFRCSNTAMVSDEIILTWEQLDILNGMRDKASFWSGESSEVRSFLNTFLSYASDKPGWYLKKERIQTSKGGETFEVVKPGQYSSSFKLTTDTLFNADIQRIIIEANLKYRYREAGDEGVLLVIVYDGPGELWKATPLVPYTESKKWSFALNVAELLAEEHGNGTVTVYVWNNSNAEVMVDDFRVELFGLP
jgi:hypothetical protein